MSHEAGVLWECVRLVCFSGCAQRNNGILNFRLKILSREERPTQFSVYVLFDLGCKLRKPLHLQGSGRSCAKSTRLHLQDGAGCVRCGKDWFFVPPNHALTSMDLLSLLGTPYCAFFPLGLELVLEMVFRTPLMYYPVLTYCMNIWSSRELAVSPLLPSGILYTSSGLYVYCRSGPPRHTHCVHSTCEETELRVLPEVHLPKEDFSRV